MDKIQKNIIISLVLLVIVVCLMICYVEKNGDRDLSSASPSPTPSPIQVVYSCNDNKIINAIFYTGEIIKVQPGEMPIPTGSVKISLSDGRVLTLPQTISADGSRYANDNESFIFWSKGDGALVFENDEEKNYTGCIVSTIKNENEKITVISPNGGEVWTKGQKVTITWNAKKETKFVNIRLAIFGDEDSQNFNAAIASNVLNAGSYEWTVQELYAEVWGVNDLPLSNKYRITIEDAEHNNIHDSSDVNFTIK
ncbi:MAG TPA: MliC family protein [Candidatus Paceibacterota bacterium]|nr:MliC family protein [Candidatus Paceibacterota bacterium]HPT40303.1 MliC family protein [Candidatus Paceibacterota bacterium]